MASIGHALFPRSTERASIPAYHPRAVLDAAFDVASLPGRAYASLGRPSAESYSDAMARTGPTGAMPGAMYQSEGDEFADMVLRDPFLPLGAMLSAAAPVRALGQYGRAGVEGAFNAGGSMADQYAATGRAELAPSLLAGVAGAAPGILPAGRQTRAAMISPEERAANFRNWFGDSKVVDEAGNPLTVYHGGGNQVDDFSRGPYRGILGAGYFSDSPRTAMQYAIAGGSPQKNESLSDLLRLMKKHLPDRTPIVTKVHLAIKNPVDLTSNKAYQEIFGTFSPQEIDEITQGAWIGDELDRLYQDGDIDEWRPFLETIKDSPEMFRGPTGANDDLALGNSPAFNFLTTTGQLDEFMKRRGYDGFIFPDNETGTTTYVPLSPTQIKSATGNRGTFDPSDQNITHLAAPKPATRAATPIQTLGSRLSAQAKHAALREYLSDDRPQGDTHYTSRSRR